MLSTLWRRLSNGLTQNATAAYFRAHNSRSFQSCGCCNQDVSASYDGMYVCIIPALKTGKANYMYLIIDAKSKEAAVVDPVEAKCVLQMVAKTGACLKSVFITHFHCGHQGGNAVLSSCCKQKLAFYGADDRIACLTNFVCPNMKIKVGELVVECLSIPSHTKGDVAYLVQDPCGGKALFTGDVLFSGGCGPIIEGTPKQLLKAMQLLCCLPHDTKLFGGHENTVENLMFAQKVEPENECITQKLKWAKLQVELNKPTYPSAIGDEKRFNPFLRYQYPNVQQFVGVVGMDIEKVIEGLDREKKRLTKPR